MNRGKRTRSLVIVGLAVLLTAYSAPAPVAAQDLNPGLGLITGALATGNPPSCGEDGKCNYTTCPDPGCKDRDS